VNELRQYLTSSDLEQRCRNCGLLLLDHTADRRCLRVPHYGEPYLPPLTAAEETK
jgi:hypothetical protein